MQSTCKSEVELRYGEGHKELGYGSKIPVLTWDCCFFGAKNRVNDVEVEQRGDIPVLVTSQAGRRW